RASVVVRCGGAATTGTTLVRLATDGAGHDGAAAAQRAGTEAHAVRASVPTAIGTRHGGAHPHGHGGAERGAGGLHPLAAPPADRVGCRVCAEGRAPFVGPDGSAAQVGDA